MNTLSIRASTTSNDPLDVYRYHRLICPPASLTNRIVVGRIRKRVHTGLISARAQDSYLHDDRLDREVCVPKNGLEEVAEAVVDALGVAHVHGECARDSSASRRMLWHSLGCTLRRVMPVSNGVWNAHRTWFSWLKLMTTQSR